MNSQAMDTCLRELERRRTGDRIRQAEREEKIAKEIPQVMAVRRELSLTSVKLSKMILSHQTNLSEGIEQLKGANLALQAREKELLAAHGYPADYLEMHYVCPICKDTGFADGKRCRCFEDLLRRERLKELNQVSDLELCSFDTFDLNYYSTEVDAATGVVPRTIMGNISRFCRSYAENFTPESRGLFLIGDTGLGKTHLSLAIAKDVISKGCMVAYGSAQDFLRAVEEEHFGRSEGKETLDGLLDVDLLILDDLGAEFSSSFNLSTVYNLINTRCNRRKPTIISTNLTTQELEQRYSHRVVSRLFSLLDCLRFVGKDIRQIRSRQG